MVIGISGKIGSGKDTVGRIIQYFMMREYYKSTADIVEYTSIPTGPILYVPDNFVVKKFADKLKTIVCILIGCTREQLEDQEFKNTPLGETWNKTVFHVEATDETHIFSTSSSKDQALVDLSHFSEYYTASEVRIRKEHVIMTPRLLLQLLGTNCGRDIIHPNIWVNSLMNEYQISKHGSSQSSYPNWVITDMRFPNELEAVKKAKGVTIRVNRVPTAVIDGKLYYVGTDGLPEHPSETALDKAAFDYVLENDGTLEELVEKVKAILITLHLISNE